MDNKKTKLINQGSYGCIYHPGLSCKTQKTTTKYITKVQRLIKNSIQEAKISNIIKTIVKYREYFGPIESTCNISISKLKGEEIKKCEFMIEEPREKYISNKIRYIGSETIGEYLLRVLKTMPTKLPRVVLDSYKYLLKSLTLLNNKTLVHMDLYERNILIDQKTRNPIIIDFGLSFKIDDVTNLDINSQRNIFFTYGVDYSPWCIDIAIITYITEIYSLDEIVTSDQIQLLVDDYFNKNPIFKYYSETEITEYKPRMEKYFSAGVGSTWANFITAIKTASIHSWDNYAIAALYYQIICDMHINTEPILIPFVTLLKTILLETPDNRMNPEETTIEITKIFNNMYKSSYNNLQFINKLKDPNFIENIDISHQKTKMAILKKEEQIQKLLNKQ